MFLTIAGSTEVASGMYVVCSTYVAIQGQLVIIACHFTLALACFPLLFLLCKNHQAQMHLVGLLLSPHYSPFLCCSCPPSPSMFSKIVMKLYLKWELVQITHPPPYKKCSDQFYNHRGSLMAILTRIKPTLLIQLLVCMDWILRLIERDCKKEMKLPLPFSLSFEGEFFNFQGCTGFKS